MKIPIVFSTDHNYIMQTGVCITSLFEYAQDVLYSVYIIVDNDVNNYDKEQLYRIVSLYPGQTIDFIKDEGLFKDCYQIRGISTSAYYRLLIPWLLPQYDKVIYSDVDVIFRTSLSDIISEKIDDFYCAAVPAIFIKTEKKNRNYALDLGLDPDEYINSGFLVINSLLQRKNNLKADYLKLVKNKYTYQDQDVINIVCKGYIKHISPKYCITPAFYKFFLSKDKYLNEFYGSDKDIDDFVHNINCIIHYAGRKPWDGFTFAWSEWWHTYRKTHFYNPNFELYICEKIYAPVYSFKELLILIKRIVKKLFHNFL